MKNLLSKYQRILLSMSLGCALSAVTASAAGARITLHGHVPSAVAKLTPAGRYAATNTMRLAIGLPLHNQAAMQELLQQMYDPASTNYQKFLTPEQFTEQFGPTTNDYQAVVDFARRNGLTVTRTHGNRMIVDVAGGVSDVENAFHVKMLTYHHPKESRDFFAPDSEPTVDSGVPVLHIQGLDNYMLPKSMLKRATASATPGNGTGPLGSYMGRDFRNAYVPGSTLNGSGQVVGLLQFDGYLASDISTYAGMAGLTNIPLQNVLLDGFNGLPGANNGEVCLDIEMVMSMAPALSKVVVFEAGPFGFPDDILNSMAASNSIRQLSSSWGYTTDPVSDQVYQEFALQGQTYLNCSGDGDAWVGGIPVGSAEDANVTVVGGTTLTMNGTGTSYASEKAWNWGFNGPPTFWNPLGYVGTSGGISTDVSIPFFQKGINMVTNQGSTTFRNVPDVALTADNIFVVADGGQLEPGTGGTSAATPLWAGFMALVNQQATAYGNSPVGFLAPRVYSLLKTNFSVYTNCFHDVTTGDNTWPDSPTNFFAVSGYDLATGLGTPNGTNMINFLAGPINTNFVSLNGNAVSAIAPPPQPYGTTMSTLTGSSPNGTWALFVQDDIQFNTGMISNGWVLNLTLGSPLGAVADPGLTMIASTGTILPGGRVVYYLSVTNYGGFSTATNVIVDDTLPSGATYVSNSVTAGSVTVNGQFLEWTVGNLVTNAGARLAVALNAPSTSGAYFNYGTLSSSTPDPNPDNNTVQLPLTVTLPSPPTVVPRFASSNGSFSLTVNGAAGTTTIEASTDLKTWTTIYTTNSAASFIFTDPNKSSYQYRFYQVISGQ